MDLRRATITVFAMTTGLRILDGIPVPATFLTNAQMEHLAVARKIIGPNLILPKFSKYERGHFRENRLGFSPGIMREAPVWFGYQALNQECSTLSRLLILL